MVPEEQETRKPSGVVPEIGAQKYGRLSTSNLSELGSILRHPPGFSRAEDADSDLQLYRGEWSSAAIWVPVRDQHGRATGMNCL